MVCTKWIATQTSFEFVLVFIKADEPWRNQIVQNTRVSNDVLQLKKNKHNRIYLHHDSEYLLSMLTMTFK